jgi:hypothetical protein
VRDGRADETLCRHHSRFAEATGPGGECGRQRMVPRIIDFGPEAKAAWVAFYDLIEAAMAEDGSLECLRDVAGKAAENAGAYRRNTDPYGKAGRNNHRSGRDDRRLRIDGVVRRRGIAPGWDTSASAK